MLVYLLLICTLQVNQTKLNLHYPPVSSSNCTVYLHCPPAVQLRIKTALSPCTVHLHCLPAMSTCHVQPRSNTLVTALSTTCPPALLTYTVYLHLHRLIALSICAAHRHCPPTLSSCTVHLNCPSKLFT
jgi:hypothetical protein